MLYFWFVNNSYIYWPVCVLLEETGKEKIQGLDGNELVVNPNTQTVIKTPSAGAGTLSYLINE